MPSRSGVSLAVQTLVHSLDPRNATLEPETYGDADAAKYGERKPLIWFWMMYDRSPVGLNHWLGHKVRAMLARHVFKHCGNNVKIFHGVEFSFGYNLTVEDNCTIHKYVLLDDRGEIIIHEGSSVSDYANIYSHAHDLNDGMIVSNHKTEIGPKARITYHATVLSGVKVGEHGMVGSMGVASKDVDPFTVVGGIPAKPIKIKSIAPETKLNGTGRLRRNRERQRLHRRISIASKQMHRSSRDLRVRMPAPMSGVRAESGLRVLVSKPISHDPATH